MISSLNVLDGFSVVLADAHELSKPCMLHIIERFRHYVGEHQLRPIMTRSDHAVKREVAQVRQPNMDVFHFQRRRFTRKLTDRRLIVDVVQHRHSGGNISQRPSVSRVISEVATNSASIVDNDTPPCLCVPQLTTITFGCSTPQSTTFCRPCLSQSQRR